MRTKEQRAQIQINGIQAAAAEIGVSLRTLQRWMHQTYTTRTAQEGREVQRPRVDINESQTAKCGAIILRGVYDAKGVRIWHAHRPRYATAQELAELVCKLNAILQN